MDKLTWNELDNAETQYWTLVTRAFRGNPKMMEALQGLYKISPQTDERIRYLGASLHLKCTRLFLAILLRPSHTSLPFLIRYIIK